MRISNSVLSFIPALALLPLALACPTSDAPSDTTTDTGDDVGDTTGDTTTGDTTTDTTTDTTGTDTTGTDTTGTDTTGTDTTGTDTTGTDTTGTDTGGEELDPCTSLDLDGIDDSLSVDPVLADSFTIEAWIRPDDTERGFIVAQKSLNGGFQLWFAGGQLRLDLGDDNTNTSVVLFGPFSTGTWYHVAAIYDGTSVRAAVNGMFGTSQDHGYALADKALSIGGRDNAANDYFDGEIHALRISEGARYVDNFQPPEMFDNDAETLRLWQLNEGMGEIAADEASNSEDMIAGTANWVLTCPWADAPDLGGCADGEREGFVDVEMYPDLAGCSGGWLVPGIIDTLDPTCDLGAGDDSDNPEGEGCSVADLCEDGWHVCSNPVEVDAAAMFMGCGDATLPGDPPLFFLQRESGMGNGSCGGMGANDIFGCGNTGAMIVGEFCAGLDRFSDDLCSALDAPWICANDNANEANNVIKIGPEGGGVLCCRN